MGWLDVQKLLEIPLQGSDRKRAAEMIHLVQKISAKGGGTLPAVKVVPLLGLPPPIAARLAKARGDIRIHCPKGPKGKFEGTFFNKGNPVRETIPTLGDFNFDMLGGKKVWGRYTLVKNTLKMYQVEGLRLKKKLANEMELDYRVDSITLTPITIAVF